MFFNEKDAIAGNLRLTYIGKRREGGSAACRYGVFRAVFGVSGLSEENLEAGLEAVEVGA